VLRYTRNTSNFEYQVSYTRNTQFNFQQILSANTKAHLLF
jgi:hypothetical protein